MSVIRWKSFAAVRGASLCATCVWGTVRKGRRSGEVEAFCRIVSPNGLVPFPVRKCTDYADRRVPGAPAEANASGRRFGFVTTLSCRTRMKIPSDFPSLWEPWMREVDQLLEEAALARSINHRPPLRSTEAGALLLDLNYPLDFRFLFAILSCGRGNGKQALPAPLPSWLSRAGSRLLSTHWTFLVFHRSGFSPALPRYLRSVTCPSSPRKILLLSLEVRRATRTSHLA